MRLLVDARPLIDANGGVGRVARSLIDAYADRFPDDELILVTTGFYTPQATFCATRPNCRRVHLRIPNKLWSLLSFLKLVSLDQEIEKRTGPIDAIFLPNLGFTGRLKKPYLLLIHDLSFLIEPRWFSCKMRWWHRAVRAQETIHAAAHLLAVSETTKQDAIKILSLSPERISVLPLGTTLSTAPDSLVSPFKRYVLALGANDPRKNASTAIEAVRVLRQEQPFKDIELVLVGAASFKDNDPWIHSIEHPSDPELASLYQHACAFLYPSWYEGYGLPLHEAASFGTPCISSTAGALPETAPLGTLFADPGKPHHWVQALREILARPHLTTTSAITTENWSSPAEKLRTALFSLSH